MTLSYELYFDKVFGCWLGKSFCGTMGAPFEGRKELFSYEYDEKSIETMAPNDDLDLQILWLEVLERKGLNISSRDLAKAFYENCPYSPGEYAVFKSNYENGVMPPYSGSFNNSYYFNGMGCPIRSEIWACIAPGAPEIAKKYCIMDGFMDHEAESVEAEIYFAAIESMAFFCNDLNELLKEGLKHINRGSRLFKMIEDVIDWCEKFEDFRAVRELLIRHYGHPDCTNLFQNIGITIFSLILGKGDVLKSTMMALNAGFDTDCTCASVGAVLGIIKGAKFLEEQCGFRDNGYILGVEAERKDLSIKTLAKDTCAVGVSVGKELEGGIEIKDYPKDLKHVDNAQRPGFEFEIIYDGKPAIAPGESKRLELIFLADKECLGKKAVLSLSLPPGWGARFDKSIRLCEKNHVEIIISVDEKIEKLNRGNLIDASLSWEGAEQGFSFGLYGAALWRMYGPFYDNFIALPDINFWESYYPFIEGDSQDEIFNRTRQYHLNLFSNLGKDYLKEERFAPAENIFTYEDKFELGQILGFEGSCCVYLEREFEYFGESSPMMIIGNSSPYKLWLNGEMIADSEGYDYWTGENKHICNVSLKQGKNKMLIKLIRTGKSCEFSLRYTKNALFANQITDFTSLSPIYYAKELQSET
ncbi:MAG: ADP-ribosylglycohydrolase family protein [Christensenellales bacterium]|jgi:hypothetical protein